MSGKDATPSRVAARRAAAAAGILGAAWELVREQGLAGLTMRDLGSRSGMKAQSLYSYFPSKHAIYDAMFAQGYREFAEWMAFGSGQASSDGRAPRAEAVRNAHRYVEFCVSDPVRFQLLFLRTIPGFEPSPASYAVAIDVLEQVTAQLAEIGVRGAKHVDMWTAVMTGLASQQIANDLGGNRWARLVDDAVDMLLAHTSAPAPTSRTRSTR